MAQQATVSTIKQLVDRALVVSDKQPLRDSGNDEMLANLDSMVIVALISMVEDEFSITVEDEEIELEMFESFEALAGFVESKV